MPTEYVNLPFSSAVARIFHHDTVEFPSVSKAISVVLAWVFRLWLIVSLLFLVSCVNVTSLIPTLGPERKKSAQQRKKMELEPSDSGT